MELTLQDFGHYYNSIKEIREGLKSNKYMLCSGFSGCGKTSLMRLLIQEAKWDILEINSSNYDSLASAKRRISVFTEFKSVVFFFQNTSKLLLIDDMDILSNTDRNFNSFFFDTLKNKTFHFPVICITNSNYEKKIGEAFKVFDTVIHLKKLSFQQCFQLVSKHITEDDDAIDYALLTQLIKENSNDLRTVLNHLDECKSSGASSSHLKRDLRKRSRFYDLSLFDITEVMCTSLLTENEINELIAYDTNQIVSLMHENVYKRLDAKSIDVDEVRFLKRLNRTITESELINKFSFDVFSTNLWEFQSYQKLKMLNFYAFDFFKDRPARVVLKHDFPQVINKQSLAFNFNKKLIKMENQLSVKRCLLTFPFLYIFSMIAAHKVDPNVNVMKYVNKNELEVILRFVSDYDPSYKPVVVKLKSSLR